MKKKQKRQLEQNKRSLFLEQRSIVRIVLGTKSLVLGLGWRLGLQFSLGLGLGLLGLQLGKLGVKGVRIRAVSRCEVQGKCTWEGQKWSKKRVWTVDCVRRR